MRPHVNAFFRTCAELIACPEPIVEIGAFQVEGQEAISDLRPYFPGRAYVGCDMRPGPGVERIEDVHDLTFAEGEVGTFVLADTLEHVWNPHRAFAELHRCLREDGVVLFSSVMLFPIHAHPEDYWRFTPETFRQLASAFPHAAIFSAGETIFPHTVCGVAAKGDYDATAFGPLAERLADLRAPMPYPFDPFDPFARRVFRRLARMVLNASPAAPETATAAAPNGATGGFDTQLSTPGWVLTSGQWVRGWVADPEARGVEIRAGDRVMHRLETGTAGSGGSPLDGPGEPNRFAFQIDLTGMGDSPGRLTMDIVEGDDRRAPVAASSPGLLVGSVPPPTGFALYARDERVATDGREVGRDLVASLRARGEAVVVDLGCGFRKRGTIGIDVKTEGTDADVQCNLGFEPIPLDDESADAVYCQDFLEHLPKGVYSDARRGMIYPIIDLFNEIWRILKPGGVFTSRTPGYPNVEIHQDPTHLSVWTLKSMDYFCGKYPVAAVYGVKARFELVANRMERFYLYAELRKPDSENAVELGNEQVVAGTGGS